MRKNEGQLIISYVIISASLELLNRHKYLGACQARRLKCV